jgi:hypothetical protein
MRAPVRNRQGECGSTRSMEWGVGPGGGVPHRGCCPAGKSPARHIPEGTLPGPVRSQGRVARCVIQNWSHVLSAPRRAWNLHGNNGARCMVQLPQVPIRQMPIQQVPLQSGPLQSDPLQQVKLTESAPEGTGGSPSSALLGAPVPFGRGRQSAEQARDLAGWTSGELPGQVNEPIASWPPSADQPPASA